MSKKKEAEKAAFDEKQRQAHERWNRQLELSMNRQWFSYWKSIVDALPYTEVGRVRDAERAAVALKHMHNYASACDTLTRLLYRR